MPSKPTKRNQISEIAVAPTVTAVSVSLSTLEIAGGSIFTNVSTGMVSTAIADSFIVPIVTGVCQV